MSILKSIAKVAAATALFVSAGSAGATVLSGNFNEHAYAVLDIYVANAAKVDFFFTGGYGDATFSLFSGSGAHLVSNDDSSGLNPHITQNLAAGEYKFVVSYCCKVFDALINARSANSDGFNTGSYYFGGNATVQSVSAYLNTIQTVAAGSAYRVQLTNAVQGLAPVPVPVPVPVPPAQVPEPASVALFGAALAGLAVMRRRKGG
jgi:hypothetical protein